MATYAYDDKRKAELANLWGAMTIKPNRLPEFTTTAQKIIKNKARYKSIERATGVPAALIGVLHEREASGNFSKYLGNGDPLDRKTTHVPAGRGPFRSFEEGAVDALNYDGLAKVTGWTIERALWEAERYNGLGYRNKGLRSPYVWGGSNQQQPGKYVADGQFDPNVMDTQPGVAPLLLTIETLDPDLAIGGPSVTVSTLGHSETVIAPKPSIADGPVNRPGSPVGPVAQNPVQNTTPAQKPDAAASKSILQAIFGGTGLGLAYSSTLGGYWPWIAGVGIVLTIGGFIFLSRRGHV